MKKNLLVISILMMLALSLAACSGKSEPAKETAAATQTQPTKEDSAETAGISSEKTDSDEKNTEGSSESEGSLTGTVDENKGFMITVVSDSDSETYVFALDETQSEQYKNIKSGDKVSIRYINGLPTPDNTDTVVTDISAAK